MSLTVTLIVSVAATSAVTASGPAPDSKETTASIWLTSPSGVPKLARQPDLAFSPTRRAQDSLAINVDPTRQFQPIEGFGAAFTDTSAYLLHNRLSSTERARIMRRLFHPSDGIGLSFMRVPMGASDYTRSGLYSYDEVPPGETDFELKHFTIEHDLAYIVPVIKEALRINPRLKIMANPWSAPAWMKTNKSMLGTVPNGAPLCPAHGPAVTLELAGTPCAHGTLRSDAFATYAQYFVRFIKAYQSHGIPIHAISPVNEPGMAPDYPGMLLSPQHATEFVGKHLGPALERAGLSTKILAFDWNWGDDAIEDAGQSADTLPGGVGPVANGWDYTQAGYVETMMADAATRKYVDGVAWHGYTGAPSSMTRLHELLPELPVYETEHASLPPVGNGGGYDATQLLIRSTRNWARVALTWNLALDSAGGPKIGTGCNTCFGTVVVDDGKATPTREFFDLGHFSKFLRPGAMRIWSSDSAEVENVAFRNHDGQQVLVMTNSSDTAQMVSVHVPERGWLELSLNAGDIVSLIWD